MLCSQRYALCTGERAMDDIRPDLLASIRDVSLAELERAARARNESQPLPLREWTALAEAWRIAQALRDARGNRTAAARDLGIGRRTLYSKMEKLGLAPVWLVTGNGQGVEPLRAPTSSRNDNAA